MTGFTKQVDVGGEKVSVNTHNRDMQHLARYAQEVIERMAP